MNESGRQAVLQVTGSPSDVEHIIAVAGRLRSRIPDLTVRIIVSGAALAGVIGEVPIQFDVGVSVEACAYGLSRQGLSHGRLRPGVTTVPTAISALVDAQLAGAAYVKI